MYTTREEVNFMVTSLQQKEDTLKKVESGHVPDAPEIPHKPVDTTDPEVVTVQVNKLLKLTLKGLHNNFIVEVIPFVYNLRVKGLRLQTDQYHNCFDSSYFLWISIFRYYTLDFLYCK